MDPTLISDSQLDVCAKNSVREKVIESQGVKYLSGPIQALQVGAVSMIFCTGMPLWINSTMRVIKGLM
jgi:hypothetical protein